MTLSEAKGQEIVDGMNERGRSNDHVIYIRVAL